MSFHSILNSEIADTVGYSGLRVSHNPIKANEFAFEGLTRISTALLEFLDAQNAKTEPDMPGMRHIRSHGNTRDKEVTAVIKRGTARVVLCFREGCEERHTPTDQPVYLTSDNQVCGHIGA